MIDLLVTLRVGTIHRRRIEGRTLEGALGIVRAEFGGCHIREVELFGHPDPAFVGLKIFFRLI